MSSLTVDCGFKMSGEAPHPVGAFARLSLDRKTDKENISGTAIYWDASFYHLDKSSIFQKLAPQKQENILRMLSHYLVREAFFIERVGMAYAAKMILVAQSLEERMFYCGMAAEEARHYDAFLQLLGADHCSAITEEEPFLFLLGQTVEHSSREVLLFIIQIVLEGWGLHHYRDLARGTTSPQVAEIFRNILQDEARHHGSGIALFSTAPMDSAARQQAVTIVNQILDMVRVGPQYVIAALARETELPQQDIIATLSEISAAEDTASKLSILKSLISKADTRMSEELLAAGKFSPLNLAECADIALGMLGI